MLLWPDVHRIEGEFNGNALCVYLLRGPQATVLIDSGVPSTPDALIFPYLERVGVPPAEIAAVIVTHASADHFGGNAALRRAAPRVQIIAHRLDVDSITDVEHHLAENFADAARLGYPWPEVAFTSTRALFGPPVPVDWAAEDGEVIDLGDNWRITLLHTPGHTPGHLSVWDPRHRAIFIGDAILGAGVISLAGRPASPPPYFDADDYLNSIATVEALAPEYILATHYPVMSGGQVSAFLEESRAFVARCERALLELLAHAEALSFREAVEGLEARVGPPGATWRLTARAHLNRLVSQGRARAVEGPGYPVWVSSERGQA